MYYYECRAIEVSLSAIILTLNAFECRAEWKTCAAKQHNFRTVFQPYRRERRICRFCRGKEAIEDEGHLIIRCEDPRVTALRTEFLWRAREADDSIDEMLPTLEATKVIAKLLHRTTLLPMLMQYIHDLLSLCEETPLLVIRSEEEWAALG